MSDPISPEDRWEQGVEHDPRSEELGRALARIDYANADSMQLKFGGDGDNGEDLLYLLDCYFAEKDKEPAPARPIQKAVDHILNQVQENGMGVTPEMRVRVRREVKEGLVRLENSIFRDLEITRQVGVHVRHIRVYQSGAFNLQHFAPGGIIECDDDGKPIK